MLEGGGGGSSLVADPKPHGVVRGFQRSWGGGSTLFWGFGGIFELPISL